MFRRKLNRREKQALAWIESITDTLEAAIMYRDGKRADLAWQRLNEAGAMAQALTQWLKDGGPNPIRITKQVNPEEDNG